MGMTESFPRRIGILPVAFVLAMATLAFPGWNPARAQERESDETLIDIDVTDMRLGDILEYLGEEGRANIVVGLEVSLDRKITITMRRAPFEEVLRMVARKAGCTVRQEGEGLFVLQRSPDAGKEWSRSFEKEMDLTDAIRHLDIAVGVGQIRVQEKAGDVLVIDARVRVDRDEVPTSALTEVMEDHVEIAVEGGTIRIRDLHREGETPWKVHVVVKTPRPLAVRAITGVGAINLYSAAGEVDIQSGVGDLKAYLPGVTLGDVRAKSGTGKISIAAGSFQGEVSLQSGVGAVTLECGDVAPERDLSVRTGVGAIRLRLPEETPGRFRMRTGTGEIRVEPEGAVPITKGIVGASAEGEVGGGGPLYEIRSGTGQIEVRFSSPSSR
jgi:hypothetical protein